MASNITLSSSVRQNLLSLQNTASLMSTTQNRLATGKKVNSALDNPGNFFTSQSLNNRASDLNSLLDSIGQATQTLKAADQGISSLTKLVESAKSIAKQARQAPQPSSATYSAVALTTGNPTDETLAATTAGTPLGRELGDLFVRHRRQRRRHRDGQLHGFRRRATADEIQDGLAAALTAAGVTSSQVTFGTSGGRYHAAGNDCRYRLRDHQPPRRNTGLSNGTSASTSLLDNIGTAGTSLTIAVNGGANQVINFGNGAGEVSTLAELNSTLASIGGITASVSNGAIAITLNSSTSQNSISISSSNAAVTTALGLGSTLGSFQGTASVSVPNSTRTSLQSDYNNIVTQLDTLAADASYGGVNLLER